MRMARFTCCGRNSPCISSVYPSGNGHCIQTARIMMAGRLHNPKTETLQNENTQGKFVYSHWGGDPELAHRISRANQYSPIALWWTRGIIETCTDAATF